MMEGCTWLEERRESRCRSIARYLGPELHSAAAGAEGDAGLWLFRRYRIFVELTSVLRLPRGVPPLKIRRNRWRPALRLAAASLARLGPDGRWNGWPDAASGAPD